MLKQSDKCTGVSAERIITHLVFAFVERRMLVSGVGVGLEGAFRGP